ncbi:MAG: hypothetical protein ACU0GG_01675 [Paracoccaceae bacterium]
MTTDHDDPALETLFEAARRQTSKPGADLMARLALDVENTVRHPSSAPSHQPAVHWSQRFRRVFAASGLSSAAALGLWIGFIAPDLLSSVTPLTEDTVSLSAFLPGSDLSALSE